MWLAFRRWPTWAQVLVWFLYGFVVLPPIAILGGAFTKGTFTPEEAAERARRKAVERVPVDRRIVAIALGAYVALSAAGTVLLIGNPEGSPLVGVVLVLWLIMQPVTGYMIGRAWALLLPGLPLAILGVHVYVAESVQEQDAFAGGVGLVWLFVAAAMVPGLLARHAVQRRRIRRGLISHAPDQPAGP